jgi:hypothetical protein
MLGFLASVGAVLEKFKHAPRPVLWGVGVVLGLLALDFFAHEAVDVYVKIQTARPTIERANEEAKRAKEEAAKAKIERDAKGLPAVKFDF